MKTSNKSIANKYRPLSFDDVRGQESTVASLRGKIRDNKVPQTALFCGKHGTGKTTLARILAKAVNCEHPDENGNPCCKCSSCLSVDFGTNPDVMELDAASRNKVEDVEVIVKQAQYLPTGKKRVIILDEAHMFSKAAQNKLLKLLEEPPAHTMIILCTTEENGLLDTILSRCNKFSFRSLQGTEILDNLRDVCEKEHFEYEDAALRLIAQKADGHVRDSLSLLEQLSYCPLTEERVRKELGIPTDDQIFDLLQVILLKDMKAVMLKADEILQEGNTLGYLKTLVETLCYICTFEDSREDTRSDTYRAYALMIREATTPDVLLGFVDIITRSLRDNRGLGLDLATKLAFLEMVAEKEKEDKVAELKKQVESLENRLSALSQNGGVPVSATVTPPTSAPQAEVSISQLAETEGKAAPEDGGWVPATEDIPFAVEDVPFTPEPTLEEIPFALPTVSVTPVEPAEACVMPKVSVTAIPSSESPSVPEGFAIPGGTIVNAAPQVPVTVNVSEGFAIPGGTIVNATPQVSSMPTTIPAQVEQEERKEVLTDEQVTPTNSLNGMDVSDIGSFAFGGFGSMDARQW